MLRKKYAFVITLIVLSVCLAGLFSLFKHEISLSLKADKDISTRFEFFYSGNGKDGFSENKKSSKYIVLKKGEWHNVSFLIECKGLDFYSIHNCRIDLGDKSQVEYQLKDFKINNIIIDLNRIGGAK